MSANCNVMCPIVGWARVDFCPTCISNPANASRKEDTYVDSEFTYRGRGAYDDEPEDAEYERVFGGAE